MGGGGDPWRPGPSCGAGVSRQAVIDEQQIAFTGCRGKIESSNRQPRDEARPTRGWAVSDISNLHKHDHLLARVDRRRAFDLGNPPWHFQIPRSRQCRRNSRCSPHHPVRPAAIPGMRSRTFRHATGSANPNGGPPTEMPRCRAWRLIAEGHASMVRPASGRDHRAARKPAAERREMGRSQVVRQRILIPPFPGSNPGAPAN